MMVTYGYEGNPHVGLIVLDFDSQLILVMERDDPYASLVEETAVIFSAAAIPGAWLVEVLPWRKSNVFVLPIGNLFLNHFTYQ